MQAYVQRVCVLINSLRVPNSDTAFRELDAEREARIEKVNGEPTQEIIIYVPFVIMCSPGTRYWYILHLLVCNAKQKQYAKLKKVNITIEFRKQMENRY